ncbi:peptidylprolyl isomerase [Flavobacterium aciduliphilum]|uniref:Peptidyl-prolyl cis-trans isomerase SurA n=1 Tax=Flavobacterium aciduliphilum TaxID=1101402 RepID=A0A328YSU1_9FLAO|nr:peptidylprolyl isomerase [Flavobacterium aciduliphilum]RAR75855.1 peptidyl-prolyl cis-trans isomerase SurA [Flavobacterium aciduliphilum]
MKLKHLFLGFLFCLATALHAQTNSKEVLFTINDKPYYTDEFLRVYNKNLDLVKDESQKDINQYLDLFIGYKLKVNKAYKLGLQDGKQYQNELKSYRTQLAKNYTTDSKVTKELVDEGYNRMQKEINASHILIMVDENAAPADTLAAYNKIISIRNRILNGEDFGTVAQETSQDPSAKENKGNLGYFTAFRMVYAFENGAYNTPVGMISMPVRTKFGYHIIKVNDIRANRGEIAVAHIMILKQKDGQDVPTAKNTIEDIYKKLQQGEKFEELAKQFSEDKSSASKGGVLNKFSSGQLSSEEFENEAFALTKENPISKPFETHFGWHIVKLIDKFPLKSYDDSKYELENKISKDDRSRLITNSYNEKLRKKYPIKKDVKLYNAIVKTVNDSFYDSKWTVPTDMKKFSGSLFYVASKPISGETFLNYIQSQQKSNLKIKPIEKVTEKLFDSFADEQRSQYNNDNLENEFPEFAAVMDEYRDGLLLFDLMDKEIWQRSKNDSVGLKAFYETQKEKHVWKTRVHAELFSSTNLDLMKKVLVMIKKNKTTKEIKDKFNTKDLVNVMSSEGFYEEGADALPKDTKMEVGISDISHKGDYYFIVKINKVLPPGYKTLEECKGKLVNDYQQYLENNWVNELKKEFTIHVNQDVFEKVKTQIKNK